MRLTSKQVEILSVIQAGNPIEKDRYDVLVDMDQLLDRLSYEPTKQSLQFSMRALRDRGLVFKSKEVLRRGRWRVTFELTEEARQGLSAVSDEETEISFGSEELGL